MNTQSTQPRTFRAAVVRTPAGPDSIELVDLPLAEPGAGEIRVRVAAAPVNPVDLGTAGGWFHQIGLIDQPERTGLGWDFAGTVDAVGAGVDLPIGARVAGLVGGLDRDFGTYAEQLVLPAADVAVIPDDLGLVEAATHALTTLTAAQLVDLLGEGEGRALLVTGAAGPVGAVVVPLAAERGWRVTGLARPSDEEFVRGLGADFLSTLSTGWDAVADGAVLQAEGVALVRDGGLFVGMRPGDVPPAERDVQIVTVGVVPDGRRTTELLARVAAGEIVTRVAGELPLAQAAEAHRIVAKGGVRGRWVLRP